MTRRPVLSVAADLGAIACFAGALAVIVHGYPHAEDTACPGGAHAPVAFWPLLAGSVVLAILAFVRRPRRQTGADTFAFVLVIAVPLAALLLWFGFAFTYACWE